jgi:hypothetical protein
LGRREACVEFWWENLRKKAYWGDLGVDGNNIRMDLQELG